MRIRLLAFLGALAAATMARTARADAGSTDPSPFRRAYFDVELTRNYPESFSQAALAPGGGPQPAFVYQHVFEGVWLMGLGGQFKLFQRKDQPGTEQPSRWLALATVEHEMLYALRLSYPVYLLLGPKILYMLPCENAALPLTRDKDYLMEIGGAASVAIARMLPDGSMLTLRADLWRGTSTQRLHGLEIGAGYAYGLR